MSSVVNSMTALLLLCPSSRWVLARSICWCRRRSHSRLSHPVWSALSLSWTWSETQKSAGMQLGRRDDLIWSVPFMVSFLTRRVSDFSHIKFALQRKETTDTKVKTATAKLANSHVNSNDATIRRNAVVKEHQDVYTLSIYTGVNTVVALRCFTLQGLTTFSKYLSRVSTIKWIISNAPNSFWKQNRF